METMTMLKNWKTAGALNTFLITKTDVTFTTTVVEAMKMLKTWVFPKTCIVNFSTTAGMTTVNVKV